MENEKISDISSSISMDAEPQNREEGDLFAAFPFTALVLDVQIYIISTFFSPRDLQALSLVSRNFKSLATPALYTDVQLVFGLTPRSSENSRNAEGFTERLVSAQEAFNLEMTSHLERTSYVRRLAWQFGLHTDPAITSLFPLLHNLRRVHLIDPHPTHIEELDVVVPRLFPRLEEIKLTGITSLLYVTPILHSPQRLTTISFDTIRPHAISLQLLEWLGRTSLPCLRALSLRTLVHAQNTRSWDVSRENEVFSAWKEALLSVRSTVQSITFGLRTDYPINRRERSLSLSAKRFADVVMPVFWEGNWSRLNTLQLEGIDIEAVGMPTSGLAWLRAAVPSVFADATVDVVPRFWHSELTEMRCD